MSGRETRPTRGSPVAGVAGLAVLIAGLAVSCASQLPGLGGRHPASMLRHGASLYLHLDSEAIRDLAPALLPGDAAKRGDSILARADGLYLAVDLHGPDAPLAFSGIAAGRFPFGATRLALGSAKGWSRDGDVYREAGSGFEASPLSDGLVLLANGGATEERVRIAGDEQGGIPVPEAWLPAWEASLGIHLAKPLDVLGSRLELGEDALPLRSITLSAARRPGDEYRLYDLYLAFDFADAKGALVFSPLCKLFLYGTVRGLWPDEARYLLSGVAWTVEGNVVAAKGLALPPEALARFAVLASGL